MSFGNPFERNWASNPWTSLNDNVMGGISVGKVDQSGENLRFFGKLSSENRGGFASCRSKFQLGDFSKFSGVDIEYKGRAISLFRSIYCTKLLLRTA
jgi:hypothetical protein